ncbi:right-handed parallel beta-helix repeat-containing protein, partial [Nocardioides astragali]
MSRSGETKALYRHMRLACQGFVAVAALLAVLGTTAAGGLAAAAAAAPATAVELSEPACQEQTVRSTADADSWIDENSPFAGKGGDSILNVDGGSANVDTAVVSGRARALVRFPLPAAVPPGCVVASAKLGLFASEDSDGARAEAVRLASHWSETGVTWSNQPETTGEPVRIWSQAGYMRWNVASQVEAMLGGANHGFLIRDAAEGTETSAGHGFYGREKGESPPELVIRFAAPPSDESPGEAAPAPATPAAVACGQVLMHSTLVTNDLTECPGDGLVIGTDRIIVDLGGHLIDGVGLGSGILNDGHDHVTVRNGALQQFDYGVRLRPETHHNAIERLALREHQVAAVELFDVADSEVRGNTLDQNGGGITLVSGTKGILVADNSVSGNGGAGLLVRDSDGNRLVNNTVGGGGDLGIGLERATGNTLLGNAVSNNSDGGIELRAGSHGNLVESNTVAESGDHGILVFESDRNRLVSNTSHRMSDSGITLESASDGVVQGNDVRFNTGGLQLDGSSRNLVESNNASSTTGIGIELGGGSLANKVATNTANQNGAQGIYVSDDAADPLGNPLPELGNLILGNTVSENLADGIVVAKGGHTLTANVVRDNRGLGINAALGSIDGSGNIATGNLKPEQCMGVLCKVDWNPPETTITDHPADPTNSTSATIAFTGTDDLSPGLALRFECSVDQAVFASCASPLRRQGLAQGVHHVEVRATDLAGNTDASPASFTWRIDTTAPETSITDRPAELTASSSAAFGLAADEPDSTFECSLDGGAFTSCATPVEYAGLGEGSHTFRVRSTDLAGNTDAGPATYTWTIDTIAPETTIDTGPADPTTSTGATLAFSSEPGAALHCSLDGGEFEPCASPAEYRGLGDGSHTLRVRATDPTGNTDPTPAAHTWTVDTTAPQTTITDRPDDPTKRTSATFGFAADEADSTFQCALDDRGFEGCSSSADFAGLTEGSHTLRVKATDRAGNTDASPATYTWTVDTTAPETTITDRPVDPTKNVSATFRFGADEEGSSFECALDEGGFEPCSSPADYPDQTDGAHTFRVRATDHA